MKVKVVSVLAVLALGLTGCSSSGSTAKSPKPAGATSTSTTTPTTAIRNGELQVIRGTATGSSPCEVASPTPLSPGQVGAGGGGSADSDPIVGEHGARGMVEQLPLSRAQRLNLQQQIEQARAVVARFPTTASALADGYGESTPYVPCIGAHYTDIQLASSFNPSAPSELFYDGTGPNSKIVGLSYLVYHHNGPPAGFAGPNDHWHQHNANGGLCLRGAFVVGGEVTSPQECARLGGHKTPLPDVWMLHAWVVPGFECSWGTFSGECPELGGRLGGTAWETPVAAKAAAGDSANG